MTEASSKSAAVARESTRGVAIITVAKAYFMLTGFAQPLLLTRILGKDGYGLYGWVLNAISILNNVVVAGSIQAMSKGVAESGRATLRRGLALHAGLGLVLGLGLAVLAGPIGARERDPQMAGLLRIGAIIVADYCVYAALVGALNGQRRFRAQAQLDMTFATMRTLLVIGLAATQLRVQGALIGFAAASAVIIVLAYRMVRADARDPAPAAPVAPVAAPALAEPFGAFARRYAGFFAGVLVYQLALNIVLQGDLLVLGDLLAWRTHLTRGQINEIVGVYKAVQNFAFLPYQLLLAVTFVVFPVVTVATREGDRETTQRLVRGALRFSALALGAMLAVLTGMPTRVMRLAYRPEMEVGSDALRILSIGQGAFALSVIATTVALAAGRARAATGLMAAMVGAVLVGDYVGIALSPPSVAVLRGVALGTAGGCVAGLVAVGIYTRVRFGTFVPGATLARVAVATACAAAAVARFARGGKVMTLVFAAVTVVLYVAVLVASGEISATERAAIARRLRRR